LLQHASFLLGVPSSSSPSSSAVAAALRFFGVADADFFAGVSGNIAGVVVAAAGIDSLRGSATAWIDFIRSEADLAEQVSECTKRRGLINRGE
jgi:hypothetical protein